MKWKKEHFYDSIDHIHKSTVLKPIVSLKNCISKEPNNCIPISAVSKRGLELDVPMKVAKFLRLYPSIFEEFTGPKHNLPWFRLTPEAAEIDREEKRVYEDCKEDLRERLRRLILMSKGKVLPLKIVQGMKWYLGLPDDFLGDPQRDFLDDSFRFVEMGDGLKGLGVESEERVLSCVQRNAVRKGVCLEEEVIEFGLFPSKGLRLKRKIKDWLEEFQRLPYVSPYEDFSSLDSDSDIAEKRVVGVLHELLCLFVDHSAERRKILCLKKHLGLPQKFHKAFERHPFMFYLSMRNKTCTAILKEAYRDPYAIEKHPLLSVRQKYARLLEESSVILKNRKFRNRWVDRGSSELDDGSGNEDREVLEE